VQALGGIAALSALGLPETADQMYFALPRSAQPFMFKLDGSGIVPEGLLALHAHVSALGCPITSNGTLVFRGGLRPFASEAQADEVGGRAHALRRTH
jgi:hypothetical protein